MGAEELEETGPRVGGGRFVVAVGTVAHETVARVLVDLHQAGVTLLHGRDVVARDPLVAAAEEAQQRAVRIAQCSAIPPP